MKLKNKYKATQNFILSHFLFSLSSHVGDVMSKHSDSIILKFHRSSVILKFHRRFNRTRFIL